MNLSEEHKKRISEGLKKAYGENRRTGFLKGQPSVRKGIKTPGWTNQTSFKKGHKFGSRFKKGHTPWNKGKNGLMPEPWNKGIKWLSRRGENHHLWKGGKPKKRKQGNLSYEEYRKYMDWQKSVFRRDNWECQICGKHGGELHADHIKQYVLYPELRWEIDNGRTLCPLCHRKTDSYGKKTTGNVVATTT